MGYKMNGFSGFGNSPAKQLTDVKKQKENMEKTKVARKKNKNKVNADTYGVQNVSKIQENKKGKYITGLDKEFKGQGGTSDTTYIPKDMKHYSGKKYKKGDYIDETDFEEKIPRN